MCYKYNQFSEHMSRKKIDSLLPLFPYILSQSSRSNVLKVDQRQKRETTYLYQEEYIGVVGCGGTNH